MCRRFNTRPFFLENQPSASELLRVESCLSDAHRARRRAFFAIEGGIDSYVATGLMTDADGNVKSFSYDSAPPAEGPAAPSNSS